MLYLVDGVGSSDPLDELGESDVASLGVLKRGDSPRCGWDGSRRAERRSWVFLSGTSG